MRRGLATALTLITWLIGVQAVPALPQSGSRNLPEAGFVPLLFVSDPPAWMSEKKLESKGSVTGDVLRLDGPSGWLATRRTFSDFSVKFSLRVAAEQTDAGVFVRFNRGVAPSEPRFYGYEIPVRRMTTKRDGALNRIVGHGGTLRRVALGQKTAGPASVFGDAWHRYEVECIDSHMTVTLDGQLIAAGDRLSEWAGSIAFEVRQGSLELREIRVKDLLAPDDEGGGNETVYRVSEDASVKPPRVLHAAKPRYTRGAMAAKITGDVTLECVVLSSGVVSKVRIVKSLDPVHGLDQEAVKAARQWRFEPGTKGGQPVAVLVQLVLTFALK